MQEQISPAASSEDRAFALLQQYLPQHLLSKGMHGLARNRQPLVRNTFIRTVLHLYPQINMGEALQSDPYAFESFNAFFTRALKPGARPIEQAPNSWVSPVDGTVSQLGRIETDQLLQAKGMRYTSAALLADATAATRYRLGSFACLYLAPYNYHRIHMPCDGRLTGSRYVPGALFSVNGATARTVTNLFARNERLVCEFETAQGALAMVFVGALFVGSIETVFAGEINPPAGRGGAPRNLETGLGNTYRRGEEIGRFNMGSTVIVLSERPLRFSASLGPAAVVRVGQTLAALE